VLSRTNLVTVVRAVLGCCILAGLTAALPDPAGAAVPPPATPDAAGTVWLCRPGLANDPCTADLDTTVVEGDGRVHVQASSPAVNSPYDCFYVYPTVSKQQGANANLRIQPAEIGAAVAQASRFSPVCSVWAPIYRQRTTASLEQGLGANPAADAVSYASVLSAWRDYLAHDNDGRPIVFIGHSQGAAMLIRLLRSQVYNDPALRSRVVSIILAGGNVTVPEGRSVGATFDHLPLCRSTSTPGCVIAYSSFPSRPPADSLFGRVGQGVSLQSGQTAKKGLQVACVNPADVGGGTADLQPYFPVPPGTKAASVVTTPWVAFPNLLSARCESRGGATWLQVTDVAKSGDQRPVVTETQGPQWGFHVEDINLALGNLVEDVQLQEAAWSAAHR